MTSEIYMAGYSIWLYTNIFSSNALTTSPNGRVGCVIHFFHLLFVNADFNRVFKQYFMGFRALAKWIFVLF